MTDATCDSGVKFESDAVLLRQFSSGRNETAFAELVRRHGPLVWGVCRRRLDRREDAEDAFQATFLRLALKAHAIRTPAALPGWLHRTACRAAIRVASALPVEVSDELAGDGLDAFAEVARREATAAIDEELIRLPNRYRDAVVLFHLKGLDRREVADRLGVSEPTVKGLLTRGRSLLRTRLARRGVALPLLLPLTVDPIPAEVAASTCRLALSVARADLSAIDLISLPSKGIQPMITWLTSKTAAATIVGALCLSLFVLTRNGTTADVSGAAEGRPEHVALETTLRNVLSQPAAAVAFADPVPVAAADPLPDNSALAEPANGPAAPRELAVNPREQRIREALDELTTLEFPQTPLREALHFLADAHEINMLIDEQTLDRDGVSIDDNVDLVLKDVTLRSALQILLEPFELTYIIEDEVMKITTEAEAEGRISTRAFDVASLVGETGTADAAAAVLSQLLEPLEGMSSEPQPRIVPFRDRIFITASAADQKRIGQLLKLMTVDRDDAGPRSGKRSPDGAAGGSAAGVEPQFKIFHLTNADATDSALLLANVLGEVSPGIGVDHRTNSLIVHSTPEQLQIIEALLLRLDETEIETNDTASRKRR